MQEGKTKVSQPSSQDEPLVFVKMSLVRVCGKQSEFSASLCELI